MAPNGAVRKVAAGQIHAQHRHSFTYCMMMAILEPDMTKIDYYDVQKER